MNADISASDIILQKKTLRREILTVRRSLPREMVTVYSEAIFQQIETMDDFLQAQTVFCYVSIAEEVQTRKILQLALQMGKTVCIPFIENKKSPMAAVKLYRLEDLTEGTFGLLSIDPECAEFVSPEAIDLIFVPGAAFDSQGHRLGMGGGFYDRYMAKAINAKRVALAFSCQRLPSVPVDSFDQNVDTCVTETGIFICTKKI